VVGKTNEALILVYKIKAECVRLGKIRLVWLWLVWLTGQNKVIEWIHFIVIKWRHLKKSKNKKNMTIEVIKWKHKKRVKVIKYH